MVAKAVESTGMAVKGSSAVETLAVETLGGGEAHFPNIFPHQLDPKALPCSLQAYFAGESPTMAKRMQVPVVVFVIVALVLTVAGVRVGVREPPPPSSCGGGQASSMVAMPSG